MWQSKELVEKCHAEPIFFLIRAEFIIKRENIISLSDHIELVEGDVLSYHIVMEAMNDVDFVLHQAALPSVPRSINDPITTNEVNVTGTINILNAMLRIFIGCVTSFW